MGVPNNDPWLLRNLVAIFIGPNLPVKLRFHSMVPLANGQAIIGKSDPYSLSSKIYFLTCSNLICTTSILSQNIQMPRMQFVAIPLPDEISGCIFGGKTANLENTIHHVKIMEGSWKVSKYQKYIRAVGIEVCNNFRRWWKILLEVVKYFLGWCNTFGGGEMYF